MIVPALQNIAEAIRIAQSGFKKDRERPPAPSPDRQDSIRETNQKVAALALQEQRAGERTVGSVNEAKGAIETTRQEIATGTQATRQGAAQVSSTTRSAMFSNAAIVAGATRAVGASIVAALYATRVEVNVTSSHITRNTTIQNRYGPGQGSAGQPAHDLI
jgi:hypothetical protein